MMTLENIDGLTRKYADAHGTLSDLVCALNDTIEHLKREALPAIRKAAASAMERRGNLEAAVQGAPELFATPRTVVMHGVRVGYRKQKGTIRWENEQRVCELVHKLFPDRVKELLHVEETPNKTALNGLALMELRKLGVEVTEDSDKVVIEPARSDVDKLVAALLKGQPAEG
jgi:hypothetical protein